jgi:hypothetical protein
MRHLDWMFDALGIDSDKANRRLVDTELHRLLGLDAGAHCPEVWAAYKVLSDDERMALVPELREGLGL